MNNIKVPISIIVAAAQNNVIGQQGNMPWRLPTDLKYFKEKTMGKPIIMGRKTWESIGMRPLPKRSNIIISRQKDFSAPGAHVFKSLEEALEFAQNEALAMQVEEIFVIGGGNIYQQVLPYANKIFLTRVMASMPGDTFFEFPQNGQFVEVSSQFVPAETGDSHDMCFIVLERV